MTTCASWAGSAQRRARRARISFGFSMSAGRNGGCKRSAAMNLFDETPMFPSQSAWAPPPAPTQLSSADLAHAAVLEQMAHGATYNGDATGDVVSHDSGPDKTDRRAMLAGNGYDPEPRLISGKNGLQMVVYLPLPGSGAKPVVSFRGTSELADVRSDLDPDQVGADQYEANQQLIDDTMKDVAEELGPVEVTGHSLGGALAQMAASHNPEVTGHITTFQAAGVDADDVARLEEHNRQREEAGLPPITADHFRVAGDIVPVAGEGFAPGTIHEMAIDAPPVHLPVVGNVDLGFTDPITAHTSHPVTAAAMATAEGRAALPGIPAPAETVTSIADHDVAAENAGSHHLESARSWLGGLVEDGLETFTHPRAAAERLASLWEWVVQ